MYIATENNTTITVDGTAIMTGASAGDVGTYIIPATLNSPGKPLIV